MLYCPKCKRNQDTIEVYRTATVVTYRCTKCGSYIPIPVRRKQNETRRSERQS